MTTWTDLIIADPASIAEGQNLQAVQWIHAECGTGEMEVSDDAELRCKNCGETSQHHLRYWRFSCAEQEEQETANLVYYDPKQSQPASSVQIAVAGQLTQKMGRTWLMSFTKKLGMLLHTD